MKELKNVEMTEEELDQVAGGQEYVFLYYGDQGLEYKKVTFEGDLDEVKKLFASGTSNNFSFSCCWEDGAIPVQEDLDKYIKLWEEEGCIIIKKWEM